MTPGKTEIKVAEVEAKADEPHLRFRPIKLRGGSSTAGSDEVIRGRGRDPHLDNKPMPEPDGANPLQIRRSGNRFNPVPIRGEPLSVTIIRDRGER